MVYITSVTIQLACEPIDGMGFGLTVKNFLYFLSDVQHEIGDKYYFVPMLRFDNKKAWNDVQFIVTKASPNAYYRINSPLPRHADISVSRAGSGYAGHA